jgi:hypothetical protein
LSHRNQAALAALALALCLACSGDLVLRPPREAPQRGDTPLSALPPMKIAVPPAEGGASTRDAVGERAGALGGAESRFYLTDDPDAVVWWVVTDELRAAGHEVVRSGGDASVSIRLQQFAVNSHKRGLGWDVTAEVRFSLHVARTPGAEDWSESVYTAERSQRTYLWPGTRTAERVLGGCLEEVAALVAKRDSLAAALARARAAS